MKSFTLKETKQSPLVSLNTETGVFEFRGSSFLDNAHEFYTPILEWLKEYEKTPAKNTKIVFDMNYINTSSQRMMFDIFKRFNSMFKSGKGVSIDWLYDENDDDLKDVGEDLLSFMDFPYKIIEKVR